MTGQSVETEAFEPILPCPVGLVLKYLAVAYEFIKFLRIPASITEMFCVGVPSPSNVQAP